MSSRILMWIQAAAAGAFSAGGGASSGQLDYSQGKNALFLIL